MTHPPSTPNSTPADPSAQRRMVPLTVWLCSDTTDDSAPARTGARAQPAPRQRRPGRELCAAHRQRVGHQLATHLIEACTREGDLVAEAFTTSEATLLAAAESNRCAIALVPHFPLARHIGTHLRAGLGESELARVQMRPVRPDQMAYGLADHLGDVDLIIAAPPPTEPGGRPAADEPGCPACRAEVSMLTTDQLRRFLYAARRSLRPGGILAVITTAGHHRGRLIDPAPRIIRHAQAAGFGYAQHIIALRVPIRGDTLVVQAGPTQLVHLHHPATPAPPPTVTVHADVVLFISGSR